MEKEGESKINTGHREAQYTDPKEFWDEEWRGGR
jgi:hypothetical protein